MPVVVNELVLRGSVQEPATSGRSPARPSRDSDRRREAIVDASVEKVMEILQREKER